MLDLYQNESRLLLVRQIRPTPLERENGKMAKHWDVTVLVEFQGVVCAETQAEAEDYAYSNWDQHGGAQIQYTGVESTSARENTSETQTDNCADDCDANQDEDEEDEEETE